MRKSAAPYAGSARSSRSRNAAISSSRVRFSMKYSSTTSRALSGDGCCIAVLGLVRLCERSQDFNAAQHNAFVDLVGVEGDTDRAQQHDRQAAAEVFAELVEPGEDRRLLADAVRELRRVNRQAQRREQRD